MENIKKVLLAVASLGVLRLTNSKVRRFKIKSVSKKTVVITGGSRGLGFALAEEYLQRGARVFLCARNKSELEIAQKKLSKYGSEVMVYPCDITNTFDVKQFADRVKSYFGSVDILINNAGIIEVGPFATFKLQEIHRTINLNLLGMIRVTLNFIPLMLKGARIINITSIGGAVAVPHLLPYTISKFGALGFSLGLDSELSGKGISVTSVLPGLMRTGSFVHAGFKGKAKSEFNWFALAASLPFLTISATNAAKQIRSAGQRRKRLVVLGPQAKVLRVLYQLFPESMLSLMRLIVRFLPKAPSTDEGQHSIEGLRLRHDFSRGGITRLGDQAGDELNETLAS